MQTQVCTSMFVCVPPPPHTHTNMNVHTCGHSDNMLISQTYFLFTKDGGFLSDQSALFCKFKVLLSYNNATKFYIISVASILLKINLIHTKGSTSIHVPSMVFILPMLECETGGQSYSFKACHLMMLSIAMSIQS